MWEVDFFLSYSFGATTIKTFLWIAKLLLHIKVDALVEYLNPVHMTKFSLTTFPWRGALLKSWPRHVLKKMTSQGKVANLCRTHKQIKLVKVKLVKGNLVLRTGLYAFQVWWTTFIMYSASQRKICFQVLLGLLMIN